MSIQTHNILYYTFLHGITEHINVYCIMIGKGNVRSSCPGVLLYRFIQKRQSAQSTAYDSAWKLLQLHKVGCLLCSNVHICTSTSPYFVLCKNPIHRVIHKSLRDFRTPLRNNQYRHGIKKHINRERERDTPSFCPNLQMLDMCTLGVAADVNPVFKFLRHALQHLAVDSSDCLHDPLSQLW